EARQGGVGHDLDVLDPLAGGALRLEEARVVDRERRAVGDELQQLDLVLPELPRLERADVEDALDLSLADERHAEQRPDALLPEDRVEDVAEVDVVEDEGALLRRDPAGEADADGDPDALLD